MLSRCDRLNRLLRTAIRRVRERRDLRREIRGELNPYRRLIVVTGMARSGTSATTAFLGSHPDIQLVIGGGCWPVVETDLLRPEMGEPDWDSIDELLRDHYPRRVLLKQPWLQPKTTFFRAIRPAKVVVCLRDRREQICAWQGTDRASARCRMDPGAVYEEYIRPLSRMLAEGATWVYQDRLDASLSVRLGKYLGVDPDGFDTGILDRRWRECLEKEWLDKRAVKKERRR